MLSFYKCQAWRPYICDVSNMYKYKRLTYLYILSVRSYVHNINNMQITFYKSCCELLLWTYTNNNK